jgi:hypothetical protein
MADITYKVLLAYFLISLAYWLYKPYYEIDLSSYKFQLDIFDIGIYDYKDLNSQNGKCYYPAGYLYLYSFLFKLASTELGINEKNYKYTIRNLTPI